MIIDVRNRPPSKTFLECSITSSENVSWISQRAGFHVPKSYTEGSMQLWLEEMDKAGITKACVIGRAQAGVCLVSNDHIADLQDKYHDRIVGVAGVDVSGVAHNPIDEIEKSVKNLGLKGICIEPTVSLSQLRKASEKRSNVIVRAGLSPADPRLYPIYEKCIELNMPVLIFTTPWAGRDYDDYTPASLDRVAADFPSLKIVAPHGGWPHVVEIAAVAFKHPNFYISADMFTFFPGSHVYVEIMKHPSLQDQFLFGSSYPFQSLDEAVNAYLSLDLSVSVRDKIMYENAMNVFGL